MAAFQMAVQCPTCEETIFGGLVIDHTNGDNVILLDLFANESFHCGKCGTTVYTGDPDCFYEYETVEDDDDEL